MSNPVYLSQLARGGELLRAGRLDEACAELERARAARPDDARAQSLLGVAYFRSGRLSDARQLYAGLVTGDSSDPSLRLNYGLVLLKGGDAAAAVVELSHARDLGAAPARTAGYLGLAYARLGRFTEARDAFRAAGQDDLAHDMEAQIGEAEPARVSTAQVPEIVLDLPDPPRPPEPADTFARERGLLTIGVFGTEQLIRPDDGDLPFEIVAGGILVVRVRGRVLSRTEGVLVSGGNLAYEPATRQVSAEPSDDPLGSPNRRIFFVSGSGHLIATPRGGVFSALRLRDDVVYIREDLVYAFEEQLDWKNGEVAGSAGAIPVLGFHGHGCIAVRTRGAPLTIKLSAGKILYVDAGALAGWIGEVHPRVVEPAAGGAASAPFVECTGEGVLLVQEPAPEVQLGPPT